MLRCIVFLCVFHSNVWSQGTHAKADETPKAPTITGVQSTDNGVLVTWEEESTAYILFHQIRYVDELERERIIITNGNERTALLKFLRPCMDYTVWVKSRGASGWSNESEPFEFVTNAIEIPTPPTMLNTEINISGRVLRWKQTGDSAHIRLYRIVGQSDDGDTVEQIVPYDSEEALLEAFDYGHNYTVSVYAENLCGSSGPSESVTILELLAPNIPRIVNVEDDKTSISIYFEPGETTDHVDYYHVRYTTEGGYKEINDLPGSERSIRLTDGIKSCFNHTIELVAVNAVGQSKPAVLHWTARSADKPETPKLTSVIINDDEIVATWDVRSNLELISNHILYRSTKGHQGYLWVPGAKRSAVLTFVHRCDQYIIQMTSENQCGLSDLSNELMFDVLPLNVPESPYQVTVTGSYAIFEVFWVAASPVEYIEHYEIDIVNEHGSFFNYWAPPDAQHIVLTNLPKAKLYRLSITSRNACGWSAFVVYEVNLNADGEVVSTSVSD